MVLYHSHILIPNISSDIMRVTQRTGASLQNDKRPQSVPVTQHRSLAGLTLPFHVFLNKCLPVGLTDHLICLLRGAGEEWGSREVSVRQVNVLIRAVTCLASLVETLPQAFKPSRFHRRWKLRRISVFVLSMEEMWSHYHYRLKLPTLFLMLAFPLVARAYMINSELRSLICGAVQTPARSCCTAWGREGCFGSDSEKEQIHNPGTLYK